MDRKTEERDIVYINNEYVAQYSSQKLNADAKLNKYQRHFSRKSLDSKDFVSVSTTSNIDISLSGKFCDDKT